jgi:eukaryotic-like serine/threonine-protein kinase
MKLFQLLLLAIIIIFWSCNRLVLRQELVTNGKDWIMFGGSPERVNVSREILIPPLMPAWEYDASAGFGQFGPTISGDVICVGNLRGEIHLVDKKTGNGLGSKDFGNAIYAPPILEGNQLYIALSDENGSILSYDIRKGSVIWRKSVGRIETSLLLQDERLYVNTVKEGLIALDKTDGSMLWNFKYQKNYHQIKSHSSPSSDGSIIVYGTDDGLILAVNAVDGSLIWKYQTKGSVLSTPVIEGGNIFVGSSDSTFYALDISTGNILWMTGVESKIFSSASVGGGSVFVATAGGEVICLNSVNGNKIWKTKIGTVIGSGPLLSGKILYLGSYDKHLYAVDINTGIIVWIYKTEGRIISTPVINNRLMFILSEDRSVIAFRKEGAE